MIVEFDKSFTKSLSKINDNYLFSKVVKIILKAEEAKSIEGITGVKKLKGFKDYYRLRIGDYRLGLLLLIEKKFTEYFLSCHFDTDILTHLNFYTRCDFRICNSFVIFLYLYIFKPLRKPA